MATAGKEIAEEMANRGLPVPEALPIPDEVELPDEVP